MSVPAESLPTLQAWIELVDCSILFDASAVTRDLLELTEDDPAWESDGVLWNEDSTSIVSFELLRWDEPAPDIVEFFTPLMRHLQASEYLTFECKFRLGRHNSTIMVVLVSNRAISIASGDKLFANMKKLVISDRDYPEEGEIVV